MKNFKEFEKSIWDDGVERDDPYGEEQWPPNELTIKRDILSMGYREVKKDTYAKPFGFSLYTIEKKGTSMKMTNWFEGGDHTTCIWNSQDFDIDKEESNVLLGIKYFESRSPGNHGNPEFRSYFLSPKEIAEMIL